MHRIVWDLHYSAPPALKAEAHDFDGVWAPPGNYVVELSADSKTVTEPLTIKLDPRVNLPPSALQREFTLASRVANAWAQAAAALADAERLLKTVQQRKDQDSVRLAADILDLSGIHEESENRPVKPPRRGDSLKTLTTDLQNLEHAVDGADADPSPDSQVSYRQLSQMLARALQEWDQLKTASPGTRLQTKTGSGITDTGTVPR
jgi:hypothetical protein